MEAQLCGQQRTTSTRHLLCLGLSTQHYAAGSRVPGRHQFSTQMCSSTTNQGLGADTYLGQPPGARQGRSSCRSQGQCRQPCQQPQHHPTYYCRRTALRRPLYLYLCLQCSAQRPSQAQRVPHSTSTREGCGRGQRLPCRSGAVPVVRSHVKRHGDWAWGCRHLSAQRCLHRDSGAAHICLCSCVERRLGTDTVSPGLVVSSFFLSDKQS